MGCQSSPADAESGWLLWVVCWSAGTRGTDLLEQLDKSTNYFNDIGHIGSRWATAMCMLVFWATVEAHAALTIPCASLRKGSLSVAPRFIVSAAQGLNFLLGL